MSTGTDGPVRYDVTRESLIAALGNHPLTAYLNPEARGKFADVVLGQMPPRMPAGGPGTLSLDAITAALRAAWSSQTSAAADWSRENPAAGQCAVTSLVLQDYLGGTIMRNEINGRSNYFLRLDDGTEIDLAREQFGAIGSITDAEPRDRYRVLRYSDTQRRYEILRNALAAVDAAVPHILAAAGSAP